MYLKIHRTNEHVLVAVCDRDLLGKKLNEGELEIEISERFYKGRIADKREVLEALEGATMANLFGEKAVMCAVENGFIDRQNVFHIKGVPHAQIYIL